MELIYVGQVDILKQGEALSLVVYAGSNLDSCIGAIGKEIKAQKSHFKAFNIQFWQNGVYLEPMDIEKILVSEEIKP